MAKIALSRSESVWLDECRFPGADGAMIEPEIELTRSQIVSAAAPLIKRSVDMCRAVLEQKKLAPSAIEKMILVGGPTLAPYFREQLLSELGIPLEHSVDPLTVVARGAAVFAGTQRRIASPASTPKGTYAIDLKHKPVGFDSAPLVGGRIKSPSGESLGGFTIELVDLESQWRSGRLPVSAEGIFTATLRAERGKRNSYGIYLLDKSGARQSTSPDTLTYTIGSSVDEQPLINSMGIALADNSFECFIERGRGLPAKAMKTFHSEEPLTKGQAAQLLTIPVCEGEASKGDRNRWVGELVISGANIPRDLPAHSEVEVTIEVDASRMVTVRAYVPVLDVDFEAKLKLKMVARATADLLADAEAQFSRIEEISVLATTVNDRGTSDQLLALKDGDLAREVRALMTAAQDPDAAVKCESRLLEFKRALDVIADALEWPQILAEAKELAGDVREETAKISEKPLQDKVEVALTDLTRACDGRKIADVRIKMTQLRRLYWQVLATQPAFWVYQFQQVEKDVATIPDKVRATKLCDQGRAFMSQDNLEGLRNVVSELWRLMPSDAVERGRQGYRSGLVKGGGKPTPRVMEAGKP